MTGFSAKPGSWKIMEICAPRTLCILRSPSSSKFLPQKSTRPPEMTKLAGNKFRMESAAVVLPQPDSPSSPAPSPARSAKLILSRITSLLGPTRLQTSSALTVKRVELCSFSGLIEETCPPLSDCDVQLCQEVYF